MNLTKIALGIALCTGYSLFANQYPWSTIQIKLAKQSVLSNSVVLNQNYAPKVNLLQKMATLLINKNQTPNMMLVQHNHTIGHIDLSDKSQTAQEIELLNKVSDILPSSEAENFLNLRSAEEDFHVFNLFLKHSNKENALGYIAKIFNIRMESNKTKKLLDLMINNGFLNIAESAPESLLKNCALLKYYSTSIAIETNLYKKSMSNYIINALSLAYNLKKNYNLPGIQDEIYQLKLKSISLLIDLFNKNNWKDFTQFFTDYIIKLETRSKTKVDSQKIILGSLEIIYKNKKISEKERIVHFLNLQNYIMQLQKTFIDNCNHDEQEILNILSNIKLHQIK